jgi:hypothetical protein
MSGKELTYEEFTSQPLQYTMGIRTDKGAQRMYRNEELGIQRETHTPYSERTGEWGKGIVAYFIDGDDTEYHNAAMLYEGWMRKVCGVPA